MPKEHITIDFGTDGSVKLEAHGYTGRTCEEATRYLETALGVAGPRKKKPEFYKSARRNVNRQRLGGAS